MSHVAASERVAPYARTSIILTLQYSTFQELNMEKMEQLLNMGFPTDLAEAALTATGGTSALQAADWILNRTTTPPSATSQPKLDRFFLSQPQPLPKRRKLLAPETPQLPQQPPAKPAPSPNHHPPLSERMRPRTLNDVVGQDHLLAPHSLLRSAIKSHRLPSLVLWGPPGTGKTSIAKALLNSFSSSAKPYRFVSISAVTAGVKDVRDAIDEARKRKKLTAGQGTVLFVDEVHLFNKSQQDSFLPVIEDGSIVFIGATTENPSFHLITPLLSRSRVLDLRPLSVDNVEVLLRRAADDSEIGLCRSVGRRVGVDEEAVRFIAANCDGDARVALNVLEISATTAAAREAEPDSEAGVTVEDAKEAMQCKHVASDKAGEEHYNLISALHKSMRGSDANAAIYWLARMVEGGQEPLYIARRLVRFASEDVGLADPLALNQAVACYQACHFIGMPECNVILAQCVAYLALAPKSIAVYKAMKSAAEVVRSSVGQNEGVPLHLRNAPTKLMKDFGYGKGYIYTPDDPSAEQTFLPPSIEGHKFLDWPISNEADR